MFKGPALPVELQSFTAVIQNKNVTLNWSTASENNNLGFEIQRSLTPTPSLPTGQGRPKGRGFLTPPLGAMGAIGFVKGKEQQLTYCLFFYR